MEKLTDVYKSLVWDGRVRLSVGICKWKPALLADSSRDSPWQPGTVISSAVGEVQLQSDSAQNLPSSLYNNSRLF